MNDDNEETSMSTEITEDSMYAGLTVEQAAQVEERASELRSHGRDQQIDDLDNASKLLRDGIVSAVGVIREGNGHPIDEVFAVKELVALSEALWLVENVRDTLALEDSGESLTRRALTVDLLCNGHLEDWPQRPPDDDSGASDAA